MFKFWKTKKKRVLFEHFLLVKGQQNPSISLEQVLNQYIQEYDLAVRHSIDEPQEITSARTKLSIMEDSIFANPANHSDQQIIQYIESLRVLVEAYNSLPPQALKIMKEKEISG